MIDGLGDDGWVRGRASLTRLDGLCRERRSPQGQKKWKLNAVHSLARRRQYNPALYGTRKLQAAASRPRAAAAARERLARTCFSRLGRPGSALRGCDRSPAAMLKAPGSRQGSGRTARGCRARASSEPGDQVSQGRRAAARSESAAPRTSFFVICSFCGLLFAFVYLCLF